MGKHYNRTNRDAFSRSVLRARVEKKDIASNEVAQITKRYLPPCWCGRPTIRLGANEPEVCAGCNEPVGLCSTCKPFERKMPTLT